MNTKDLRMMRTIVVNKKIFIAFFISLVTLFLFVSRGNAFNTNIVNTDLDPFSANPMMAVTIGNNSFAKIVSPRSSANGYGIQYQECSDDACSSRSTTTLSVGRVASVDIANSSGDGFSRILFEDYVNNDLIFVQCQNSQCISNIQTNILNGTAGLGSEGQVEVASDGFARLLYRNQSGNLIFRQCTNAACSTGTSTTVDAGTTASSGRFKIGSDGFARIAFIPARGTIRFFKCTNATCSTKTTTNLSITDANISRIDITSGNLPMILYRDTTTTPTSNDVRLVQCTNDTCGTTTDNLIGSLTDGTYHDEQELFIGNDGFARIFFNTNNGGGTANYYGRFIQCGNAACSSITADNIITGLNNGYELNMVKGNDGYPRLVYRNAPSPQQVIFGQCVNDTCVTPVPTASGQTAVYGGTYTRTSTDNSPWTVNFTAANTNYYQVRTGSTTATGTQVIVGAAANGANSKSINWNATGLVNGSNSLYLFVSGNSGSSWSSNYAFTMLRDDTAPTAATSISTTPGTVSGNYTVTFTPNDAASTGSNEMSYYIRTATGGGGTLLTSSVKTSTSGSPKTTASITTDTLVQGSNTRYVRTCDGANRCTDTSFTVTAGIPPTSVTAVASDPPPVLKSFKNTLKGSANPNGSTARGHFRLYTSVPNCTLDTNGTRVPSSAGNDAVLGAGSSPVAFSVGTTVPLVRQTQYWYCAYADNDAAGQGNPSTAAAAGYQTFTTPDGPAGGCDPATTGDLTITDACTFPATDFDGVDAGGNTNTNTARITLGAGGNVTILAGQKVARGSISFSGGLLTLQNGNGGIIRGGVYLLDADGDGYIDNNTSRYVGIAPPAGYVRRNYLASTTYSGSNYDYASKMYAVSTFDCNTASAIEGVNVANLAVDADQDGYYTGATGTSCVGGTSTVNGRTYYRVADGSYSKIIGSPTGGANAIAGSDCYDNTGEPCKPTINSVGSATQTSLLVTFTAGAGPAATGSALLWCDRTANASCAPNIRIAGSVTSPYTHNATITCGKNYAYKVTSQNASGESDFSADVVGTTSSCASAPTVATDTATSVTGTTATLNSTVDPNSQSTDIIYRYQVGNTSTCNSSTPSTQINGPTGLTGTNPLSGGTTQLVLTGLTENVQYSFCATASNGIGGQQYGSPSLQFTTPRTFYDTFTGADATNLSSHAPDTGSGWVSLITAGSAPGNTIVINTNRIRPGGSAASTGSVYRTTSSAADANYKVMATYSVGSSSDDYVILAGRIQDASNMYAGEFNNTQSRLYKRVSGTWTQLGATGLGIATGSIVTLNLTGSSIALLDDGVSVVEANDAAISAAGYAGVGFGGVINATGDTITHALDSFEIGDTPLPCTSSRYLDLDNDTYGAGASGCWVQSSTVNTDCYDSNNLARPNQTSFFAAHRGDSSFDYDCDGGSTGVDNSYGTLNFFIYDSCGGSNPHEPTCGSSSVEFVSGPDQYNDRCCSPVCSGNLISQVTCR